MRGWVYGWLLPAAVLVGTCLLWPSAAAAQTYGYGYTPSPQIYYGPPVYRYVVPGYYDPGFYSYRWPGFSTFRAGAVVMPRVYDFPAPYVLEYPGPYRYRWYYRGW